MQDIDAYVKRRQIELITHQQHYTIIGSLGVTVAMTILFWGVVAREYLIGWFIACIIIAAIRLWVLRKYTRNPDDGSEADHRAKVYCVLLFLAGLTWAFASVFFFLGNSPEYALFLGCMYAGMISTTSISMPAFLPCYYCFVLPQSIPLALRLMYEGTSAYIAIGLTVFLYIATNILIARATNRTIARTFRLECENAMLTEDYKRQKEISDQNRVDAESAVRDKSQFLAAASHDLRQPLHASGLLLEVLKDHVEGKEGESILRGVTESINGLKLSFNGLLDISRLDANVVEVSLTHTSLQHLMSSVATEYEIQAAHKNLQLNFDIQDTTILVDPVLFERVMRNLLSNAIRYTDTGVIEVRSTEMNAESVEIIIVDSGIGIPTEELEKIFSEYYQLQNPERDRSKGLGLGLAIVQRFCRLMDIEIKVTSQVGDFTCFTLNVPRGQASLVSRKSDNQPHQSLEGISVLIIDDDQSIQDGMRQLLGRWKCNITTAHSVDDALQQLSDSPFFPDIIFADYRLRENKTGVEAVQAIQKTYSQTIPVAIITGDTSPERLIEAENSGFRIMHKPVSPAELRMVMQQELVERF